MALLSFSASLIFTVLAPPTKRMEMIPEEDEDDPATPMPIPPSHAGSSPPPSRPQPNTSTSPSSTMHDHTSRAQSSPRVAEERAPSIINPSTTEIPQVANAPRKMIKVADEGDILVASYTLPPCTPTAVKQVYSNFTSAKPTVMLSLRKKGVRNKKAASANAAGNSQVALSQSASYAFEHLRLNAYCHSEHLDQKCFNLMIRFMLSEKWSSFDTSISQSERERRGRRFAEGQRTYEADPTRYKTQHGFEMSMRKVEKQMCWKAARRLCMQIHLSRSPLDLTSFCSDRSICK